MTSRRGFLGAMLGAAGAAVLDPERALWVPGAKLVSIPRPRLWPALAVGDVVTFAGLNRRHPVTLEDTGILQRFVIVAAQSRPGAPVPFWPAVMLDGPYMNVAAPAGGRFSRIPEPAHDFLLSDLSTDLW